MKNLITNGSTLIQTYKNNFKIKIENLSTLKLNILIKSYKNCKPINSKTVHNIFNNRWQNRGINVWLHVFYKYLSLYKPCGLSMF